MLPLKYSMAKTKNTADEFIRHEIDMSPSFAHAFNFKRKRDSKLTYNICNQLNNSPTII